MHSAWLEIEPYASLLRVFVVLPISNLVSAAHTLPKIA